jgi:thiol-disulfide isomerase/thioredoxin
MIQAHILIQPIVDSLNKKASLYGCDVDGKFNIEILDTGFVFIRFSGVDHQPFEIPFYIKSYLDTIKLQCNLKRNIIDKTNEIFALGNFNDFKFFDDNYKMLEENDSIFSVNINYKVDTLVYQIINKGCNYEHSINGSEPTYYVIDEGGDYHSILVSDSITEKLYLNIKKYQTPKQAMQLPKINILNNDELQEFINLCFELKLELTAEDKLGYYLRDTTLKNGSILSNIFNNKLGKKYQTILDNIANNIYQSNNYYSKTMLYLQYLDFASQAMIIRDAHILGFIPLVSIDINLSIIEEGLSAISPLSPLWNTKLLLSPEVPFCCSILLNKQEFSDYLEEMISSYPDNEFRKNLLTKAFNYYLELDNNEKLRNYYLGRLISEFPEDSYVKHIKREYIDRKKTQKGEKVPDFSLFDIDNKKIITEEDILGKYTLIDFWSTYCGPCIAELPTLTEAYKKYFNDEFNIISISFDTDLRKIINFRSKKFSMPWINAIETEGFSSIIAKDFEVTSIPEPILIDKNGIIIAQGHSLRGNNLLNTLDKYLKK